MLTQDELDSFGHRAAGPEQVPPRSRTSSRLLDGGSGAPPLRRTDLSAADDPIPLMFHVEQGGDRKIGHLPLDEGGILQVSDLPADGVAEAVRALWEEGASRAPGASA